ncbi:glutamate synthase-related protein [Clostridioides difficile]|uniref:glutamate synthase-related protein n=1 Tax=Clostridioides difficile TaxID=1496 RepID=UPI0035578BC7
MSIYKCSVCGYIYDESKNDKTWDELSEDWECPVCTKGRSYFGKISTVYYEEDEKIAEDIVEDESKLNTEKEGDLNYLSTYLRRDDEVEKHMDIIHEMAVTGKSIIEPMRTKLPVISWDDILIMGAQLNPLPLNEHDEVNTTTIIGKKAKKPMIIENPVYISHMSFGALSKELKIALAKGAAQNKTAMCSGEGGILPEEKEASYKYIFEYVPNKYSVTEENLKNSDAIEIKIGQGTKPGMGGHLPGEKVTEEIAKVRNKPVGQDVISPSCFEEIQSKEDLKKLVDELREVSEGRPIGVKISAGHIEKDMEFIAYAKPDFVTIDGRGGATGASPKLLKDATSIPTIFALYRARKYIDTHGLDIDLVITGGLRISTDFAKAIAMGADAVAIASSALMAAACQQYRICGSGKCPVGVATQDEELRKRLHIKQC